MRILGYEITFTKVKSSSRRSFSKKKGFTSKKWTDEDKHKLRSMMATNKTTIGMARMLGRTDSAVKAMIAKMNKEK